jgi:hypothetical protein
MRQFLDTHPYLTEKAEVMTNAAEKAVIEKVIGTSPGTVELIRSELKGIRDRLGYEDSPQVEQLIIAEIVVAWLWVQWLDVQLTKDGGTIGLIEYWQRRVVSAHKRFLRACESLARVRKLTERKPSPIASAAASAYLRDAISRGLRSQGPH